MPKNKYTIYGSDQLHEQIDREIAIIQNALLKSFGVDFMESLVLMGGYGRGEGTVLLTGGKEQHFNDYDFFVVTRQKISSKQKEVLQCLEKELSLEIGIEVDLYPVDKESFVHFPLSVMDYEMQAKSIIPYGNQNILQEMPFYDVDKLPPEEGSRLLLNRGILLLYDKFALLRQESFSAKEREKLIKYLFKALLAMGDSYLLANKTYDYSYSKKIAWIKKIKKSPFPKFDALRKSYLEAVEFKMRVDFSRYDKRDLKAWLEESIELFESYFRWYEEKRLGQAITSWKEYESLILKESLQQSPWKILKNVVINIREFGFTHILNHPIWATCYPRYRLFAMLPDFFSVEKSNIKNNKFLINQDLESNNKRLFDAFWNVWLKYS
ncbi:MAG: hypothetical protein HRT88_05770 [Lentisphaeraceae bacterium]|nr:hypothetical protein [Lentisphaeraceae bacterium]